MTSEKAQKLDRQDQRAYLGLVRGGARPEEAHSQILARQRQPEDSADDAPVSTGNGSHEETPGVPDPLPKTTTVSTGNGEAAPPAPRRPKQPVAKGDTDRRAAAAARDARCRLLLETTDPADPGSHELILSVLAAAVLAPQQQSAGQQRAVHLAT